MKKTLLVISCLLLLFTSCKKNKDAAPENTISANINGVDESFNTNAYAQLGNGVKSNSSLSIYGADGSAAGSNILTITLALNQTISTESYTSGSSSTGNVAVQYSIGSFSLANPNIYKTDVSSNGTTVVITKLTSSNIQGTFSGKIFKGSDSKTVVNGKFNLPIK
jgi:hypothetical protein